MKKERPILFSGPMVQALLDGRKTQTRRMVKPQPLEMSWFEHQQGFCARVREGTGDAEHPAYVMAPCPYGMPGDRLWVRETHYVERQDFVLYRATDDPAPVSKWTPSIHMPRWASRITLEITEIRVQRLQEISEDDAVAEGIERVGGAASCNPWKNYRVGEPGEMAIHCSCPSRSYMTLWNSINGAGSWAANPWVWCVSFKEVKG